MEKLIIRDLQKQYPDVDYFDINDLKQSMMDVYEAKKKKFVIIIDEWDAVLREYPDGKEEQKFYLDYLRDWLKDKEYVALAYMTGILPIKKYGEHSALNMFQEFSMISPMQFAAFTGFTEDEVRALCDTYDMVFEDIESWYNGYKVSDRIPVDKRKLYRQGAYEEHVYSIYSPLSVANAMQNGLIQKLLIELKYEKDADTAINQIRRQNYPSVLEKYKGNMILVGIGYVKKRANDDIKFKHHNCIIERA